MPVKKLLALFVLSGWALCLGGKLSADDKTAKDDKAVKKEEKKEDKKADNPLEDMDPDTAKEYGGMINTLFTKQLKDAQVKIEVDVDKATGLVNMSTREGIIAIPVKNFKEDRESKAADADTGMGICYLFLSQTYNPLIDGKPVDAKKLRVVKFTDSEGNEREATCLLLSAKHIEGDDWQLYVYGSEKQPLIKAQFGEASDPPKGDLALAIQEPGKDKADLVVNLFGKYAASFPIGFKHKPQN